MRALNRHVEQVYQSGPERDALGTAEIGAGSVARIASDWTLVK